MTRDRMRSALFLVMAAVVLTAACAGTPEDSATADAAEDVQLLQSGAISLATLDVDRPLSRKPAREAGAPTAQIAIPGTGEAVCKPPIPANERRRRSRSSAAA